MLLYIIESSLQCTMTNNSTKKGITKMNEASIIGRIMEEPVFSHKAKVSEESFFFTVVAVKSKRGEDHIPIMVNETLLKKSELKEGKIVKIMGQLHSINLKDKDDNTHMQKYVYARKLETLRDDELEDENVISMEGWVCTNKITRKTRDGNLYNKFILKVYREYGKADYIHCVVWERRTTSTRDIQRGDKVKLAGSLRSRSHKTQEGGTRVVYEVSVKYLEKLV